MAKKSPRGSGQNVRIKNVYAFNMLDKVKDPIEDVDTVNDMLVINRPRSGSAASRSQMQDEQFLMSISQFSEAVNSLIGVTVEAEDFENVIKVREEQTSGGLQYYLSASINNIPLDEYINDGFLTIEDTLVEEVISNGVGTVGGVEPGHVFSVGTSLVEIMNQIFSKVIPAVYTESSTIISDNVPSTIEVGQLITATLTITYSQKDSGPTTAGEFFVNGGSVDDQVGSAPFVHVDIQRTINAPGGTITFRGTVDHSQGAQKFDNFGNPSGDPATEVPARMNVSTNTLVVTGRRNIFYGTSNPVPADSDDVRSLGSSQFDTDNTFSVTANIGATSVDFGIASYKTLSSVTGVGSLISDETQTFLDSENIIEVFGQNNNYPDNYKVYRYQPNIPFESVIRYDVTLT
jgi:hypothetical protein